MSNDQQHELWEFIGAAKTRFESGDKKFDELKAMLSDLIGEVRVYNQKVDTHLGYHTRINKIIVTAVSVLITLFWPQ